MEQDMEQKNLTSADIDKVRNIEGCPVATDDAIIELSEPPYYTACPNPYLADFIEEYCTQYDEDSDTYNCKPYTVDVSEGKYDPIYKLHPYHTKVPHRAIMKYILHYTKPGDVVFDGFCGTGMAGLAAEFCGSDDPVLQAEMRQQIPDLQWGHRYAVINDISPAATFIAKQYCNPIQDMAQFSDEAERIAQELYEECSWMYETNHGENDLFQTKGMINYVVWSDAFVCPNCGAELIYWEVAVDIENGKVKKEFKCNHCSTALKKNDCIRAKITEYDEGLGELHEFSKQVPVLINYSFNGKRYEKVPDCEDLENLKKIERYRFDLDYPVDELPTGYNTEQPKKSHGFTNVHHFYTKRNLITLAAFKSKIKMSDPIGFAFTKVCGHLTKQYRLTYMNGCWGAGGGPMSGTLYIPSLVKELNMLTFVIDAIKLQYKRDYKSYPVCITTQSTTAMPQMPDSCIDYIFTDPPFGQNLMYSELNYLWESWLAVKTNNSEEAIINEAQGKHLHEYQRLMTRCFEEYYRVLKPGRWITIEFHNSKNSVWNAIQEGLMRAGFVVADIRTLDKKHDSFKQVVSSVAVKQDLIISAYKPKNRLITTMVKDAGNEETAWAFVRQHLSKLPVAIDSDNDGLIDLIAERQAYLLYDRTVAYHVTQGVPVPLDASDFYRGLDERFIKRDDMYFLSDQVTEYDTVRMKMNVESVPFSLFVTNEKTAIGWLYYLLADNPMTYQQIQPKFMQEVKTIDRYEAMPELAVLLEENFLQNDDGCWYVPDTTKEGDLAKLREKSLLREFEDYLKSKGKLKLFRSEAIRVGFSHLWKEKNYQMLVDMANKLPAATIQEDSSLLMYYDISLSRVGQA